MENNIPSAPLLPGRGTKPSGRSQPAPEDAVRVEQDVLNEHVLEPGDPDGVIEEEQRQAEAQRQAQPTAAPAVVGREKKRRWPWVVLIVVMLAAAIVGSYWYGSRNAAAPAKTSTTPVASEAKPNPKSKVVAIKHYDSSTYTLGLDYPETWTVSDTAVRLNIQSPASELTAADGSKTNVRAIITIQNPQSTTGNKPSVLEGYPADGAVAALASDKLSYKKPTEIQRADTYLSYLSYGAVKNMDRLFLTGDNGYQQGQLVPMSDVAKGNPLVSVGFVTCTNNDCTVGDSPTYQALQPTAFKATDVAQQIIAVLESLQFN